MSHYVNCKGAWCLVVFLLALTPCCRPAEPLGIAMENYAYPYPVHFFSLTVDGQDLKMGYMDVAPVAKMKLRGVVVLLHGKNFFGAYWKDTVDVLINAGFRVIVPDQLGFGKSSKPDIHYSFRLFAKSTHDLLASLNIEHATIVGHSMGGMVATRFALMYPDFTSHLVLENPIGLEDYQEKVPYTATSKLYEAQLTTNEDTIRQYQKQYYAEWKPEYDEYVQVAVRWMLSAEYPRLAMSAALTTQMIYEQPVCYEFSLLKPPTLLVIGQSDRTAIGKDLVSKEVAATMGNYPELGKKTATLIPNAKLVPIDNCGHIPHLEAPTQFHAALLEFLK
jgi:pimeloyl-ACP methyl ester carboxylesterase